jgi:hypothetical protein
MRFSVLVGLILGVAVHGHAQVAPVAGGADPAQCLGSAFGKWTPPLDWKAAGHIEMPDSSVLPRAPGGRAWAANALGRESDSTLVLFPVWWPVGVVITFDRTPTVAGDTVTGRAAAMVADGRKPAPRTLIRAWLKPCTSTLKE